MGFDEERDFDFKDFANTITKWEVYCDGSGTSKGKPGGWGFVIIKDGEWFCEGCGYEASATNNTMELMAAGQGLTWLKEHLDWLIRMDILKGLPSYDITLVSDSEYALNQAAKRHNSYTNLDIIIPLQGVFKSLNAKTRHVYGHTGDKWNERCNTLANIARKEGQNEQPK